VRLVGVGHLAEGNLEIAVQLIDRLVERDISGIVEMATYDHSL
jgi:hypothetical protein